MKKVEKIYDVEGTEFNEGNDDDDHYQIQGDIEIVGIIDCVNSIHCCKYHPKGDLFAVGLSEGSIKIYKKNNSQLLYALIDDDIRLTRLPVTCIKFFNPPNSTNDDHYKILIATYVAGYIKYWHYPSKSCIYTINAKHIEPLITDFNHTFDVMAVGGYASQLSLYDVATKKLIQTLENNGSEEITGHSSRVYALKYHPTEKNLLISGGWDNTVQIWDDRIPTSQHYIYGPHICGDSIDIDAAHNHMITGSWRKFSTLQIWDLRNFEQIRDVFKQKPKQMIYGCQWLSTSYIFTCGGEKNSAVIYDRGTLLPVGGLTELKHAVTSIDNDGGSSAVGGHLFPGLIAASKNLLYSMRNKKNKSLK